MALHLDTSLIVPLFFAKPGTRAARQRLRGETGPTTNRWALAESAGAALKIRNGQTGEIAARLAMDKLAAIAADARLPILDVLAVDYERTGAFCLRAFGRRAPDALHPAVAARHKPVPLAADVALERGCRYRSLPSEPIAAP